MKSSESFARCTLGGQTGWFRHFFDSIPTGDGELRSLRDAGIYIVALPPAEAWREHRQIAMEFLVSAAEHGGIVMMARIAMSRAINHGEPVPAPTRKADFSGLSASAWRAKAEA